MNPKSFFRAGSLACVITAMVACHTSQSTTYTKPEKSAVAAKPQGIQLPNMSQEMQVEVVTGDQVNKDKKNN